MRFILFTLLPLLPLSLSHAQQFTIKPYLQDAEPNSITIMWETDSGEESLVDYGLSNDLGTEVSGSSIISDNERRLHTVIIEGLERFTTYYYSVHTNNLQSEIYSFKTPPFDSDEKDFRFIAMSDMQRASDHPNKFEEIVNEGVIKYIEEDLGESLVENMALILIPGDLVNNGNNFNEWKNTFFNPAENLFTNVPVYPVLGNHENNSAYYYTYFSLPDNGSPGYEDQWWYKDYGNVRFIGLNSNGPFDGQIQLDWLEQVLAQSCTMDSIDFIFAQLHHPHKSELWTPGESNFTGEVIELLENFSTDCDKPSAHFFGHTHGYSRGQSRDHKHLWINVATAGGAIDNWGEFPNYDYDEFSVSQDEYGFVSVDIKNGQNPSMTIKRIGRGDQDNIEDNVIRDSLVVHKTSEILETPVPLSPMNETIPPECVVLKSSPYEIPASGSMHGQSHWQVTTLDQGFDNPVYESWKNYENWYFEVNTQASDDLTDEEISGLDSNTEYLWRVRYRDRNMNWSEWSETASFQTGESLALDNLIKNAGAEEGTDHWIVDEGIVESLPAWECSGINPYSGNRYLIVGGLCEHSSFARCHQDIDITAFADSVDTGSFEINFGGFLSNWGGSDFPEMQVFYYDEAMNLIAESETLSTLNNSWTSLNQQSLVPSNTRTIKVELRGTRNDGTDNDSYFDDLYLKLGKEEIECDQTSSVKPDPELVKFNVKPNPFRDTGIIELGDRFEPGLNIQFANAMGQKVHFSVIHDGKNITVRREHQDSGIYFYWIRNDKHLVGKGKFILE